MTHEPMIHPAEAPIETDLAPTPPIQPLWRPLLTLDVIFFLAAAITIYLAPCGTWSNNIAGVKMWDSSDPGGDYVISSLYFFPPGRTLPFIGHPGLTLQLPIWIIARAAYGLARLTSSSTPDYFSFWAQHVRWLFILSGWLVAFLHVISFHVLETTARRLMKNSRAAFFAVLGYATLFPVLFYSTRISTEPLLVMFTLGTFLNLWKMAEARAAGDAKKTWRSAAWAGACAVLGTFTKLQLAGPLVPFSFVYLMAIILRRPRGTGVPPLLLAPRNTGATPVPQRLPRALPILAYLAAAAIIGGLASARMDWHDFLTKWAYYAPGGPKQTHVYAGDVFKGDKPPAMTVSGVVGGVVTAFEGNLLDYIPFARGAIASRDRSTRQRTLNYNSLFTIAEAAFLALALAGLWRGLRDSPWLRSRTGWLIFYALLLLPVWAYRGLWHYLFIQLALGAVFFGAFIESEIAKRTRASAGRRPLLIGVLIILAIHIIGSGFALLSTVASIRSYRAQIRPALRAVEAVSSGQTVAYISKAAPVYGIWYGAHRWIDGATEFHEAFGSFFSSVTDASLLTPEWAREHHVQFILSGGSRKDPLHLTPIADWIPPAPADLTPPATAPTKRGRIQ